METNVKITIDTQDQKNIVVQTSVPPMKSSSVISRILTSRRKVFTFAALITWSLTVIFIILSIICFIFIKNKPSKNAIYLPSMLYGITATILAFIMLVFSYFICSARQCICGWIHNFETIIQLDNEIWQQQVDSIKKTVPPKMARKHCLTANFGRVRKRQYGHIVLAKEGIAVDELTIIKYNAYVIRRIELINNTVQTGFILRLFLVQRTVMYDEKSLSNDEITFELYLFMPIGIPIEQVIYLRENILANSYKCLDALGFFKHSTDNYQLQICNS
ncbi:hypothetical protein I4U23_015510 [Adineta vaga]|nr:hypothetical protein I4U23_015510 [Adineta vaga]